MSNKEKQEILEKAKAFAKKKKEALQSSKTIKKTIMPNGNVHFDKE
jgi:hypothetical protein